MHRAAPSAAPAAAPAEKFVRRSPDAEALNRLESPDWPNWCRESRVRALDFNCTRGYSVDAGLVRRRLGGATLLMIGNSHDRMAHTWLCSAPRPAAGDALHGRGAEPRGSHQASMHHASSVPLNLKVG